MVRRQDNGHRHSHSITYGLPLSSGSIRRSIIRGIGRKGFNNARVNVVDVQVLNIKLFYRFPDDPTIAEKLVQAGKSWR